MTQPPPTNKWCMWSTKSISTSEAPANSVSDFNGLIPLYECQSGAEGIPSPMSTEQITSFQDGDPGYQVGGGENDPTFRASVNSADQFADFFSRPVKIYNVDITPGSSYFDTINPWTLFFTNPRVINRITNFKLMRCKLHLKFIINSNSFYYGRILVSYYPLPAFDGLRRNRPTLFFDAIAESQRPHLFLDPTTSKGGDMLLPFYFLKDALSLPNGDYSRMGEITFRTLNNLKHANGSGNPITLSVFAWAEDMELSVPTEVDVLGLVPQSGDEYGMGIISRPASILAKISSSLSSVPIIGAYAMATAMAADSLAAAARFFGYSRPILIDAPCVVKPCLIPNICNADAVDTSTKLTLDTKQELTIDTRTVGLSGVDEMAFANIVTKPSYLTTFPWLISDPAEKLLFAINVHPMLYNQFGSFGLPSTEYHFTPCGVVASCFRYWRGTMVYRFQIVGSAFHRGRLKFVYDPTFGNTTSEYNTAFTHIVDIADSMDVVLKVKWGSSHGFCQNFTPLSANIFSNGILPVTLLEGIGNGVLSVYVVNALNAPNSTINNDISVNVITAMDDDFKFGEPTNAFNFQFSLHSPPGVTLLAPLKNDIDQKLEVLDSDLDLKLESQSGMELLDIGGSSPVDLAATAEFSALSNSTDVLKVYMGEDILSFRTLLKRYSYVQNFILGNLGEAFGYTRITIWNLFAFRGHDPNGLHTTLLNGPYSYTGQTTLHWMLPCYSGWKGGLRIKYAGDGGFANAGAAPHSILYLHHSVSTIFSRLIGNLTSLSSPSKHASLAVTFFSGFPRGAVMNHSYVNNTVEAEIPYYRQYRFTPARIISAHGQVNAFSTGHTFGVNNIFIDGTRDVYETFISTGEDFNAFFWVGPPPYFLYSDPAFSET